METIREDGGVGGSIVAEYGNLNEVRAIQMMRRGRRHTLANVR